MKDALTRKFQAIFITHGDKLARFGRSLIYQIFNAFTIRIIEFNAIASNIEMNASPEKELGNYVLAILASYSGKLYRMRHGSCS